MNTAIIFNLDYEKQPIVRCRRLWSVIETRMLASGFTKLGRIFVSVSDPQMSFLRALGVLESIEKEYRAIGESTADYLRDFYGVPYSDIVNLKAASSIHMEMDTLASKPLTQGVDVDVMATGAFQQFFG
jgi:hypothetical protein